MEDGGGSNDKSGIKQVFYYVNGVEASVNQTQRLYLKENAKVLVKTVDYAGNQADYEKSVYVDSNAPTVQVALEEKSKVVSKDVKVNFYVKEEEALERAEAKAVWTKTDGSTEDILLESWQVNGVEAKQEFVLKEEGRYSIHLKAEDQAGNVAEDDEEILVDKTGPDIIWGKELGNKTVSKLEIPKDGKGLYQDFTSCRWQVWLDDKVCQKGKVVEKEGNHHIKIRVEDSAGNVSKDDIKFVIDSTAPKIHIHGIKNNEITEKEVRLRIEPEKEKDWIFKVLINGQEERLDEKMPVFEKTIQKPGIYEIKVEARDEAGNAKEKVLKFQIEDEREKEVNDVNSKEGGKRIKFVLFFAIISAIIAMYMHNDQKRAKK